MLNTNTADWRRFCLQIITAQIGLTTQERQSQVLPSDNNSPNRTDYTREAEPGGKKKKKKERFCLQITTAQIGLTTQERQNHVKKREGSAFR